MNQSKTVEGRIIQFSQCNGRPMPLVFAVVSFRNSNRALIKGGVEKTSYFLALCLNISKTVRDTSKVTVMERYLVDFDGNGSVRKSQN